MDLLTVYSLFGIISYALADYLIRVDQFNFMPLDRELILSQSTLVEQEGNRSYLSGHLELSRSINEMTMVGEMDVIRKHWPRVRLFDKTLELCSFLNNGYKSKFMRQFYNNYVSFLNVQPHCPLKANFNYTLTRAFVDDHFLPDFLPECNYFMKLEFRHKTKRLALIDFTGHISPFGKGTKATK